MYLHCIAFYIFKEIQSFYLQFLAHRKYLINGNYFCYYRSNLLHPNWFENICQRGSMESIPEFLGIWVGNRMAPRLFSTLNIALGI